MAHFSIHLPDALISELNIWVTQKNKAEVIREALELYRQNQIVILNLMPTKTVAESQFLRLLDVGAHRVDVRFLRTAGHESKNTGAEHPGMLRKAHVHLLYANWIEHYVSAGAD